jgi:hypothetical protein
MAYKCVNTLFEIFGSVVQDGAAHRCGVVRMFSEVDNPSRCKVHSEIRSNYHEVSVLGSNRTRLLYLAILVLVLSALPYQYVFDLLCLSSQITPRFFSPWLSFAPAVSSKSIT